MKRKFPALQALYMKIVKSEGTPESIARGVALGLFCGFIIPIGLQTFPTLLLALLLRANKVLSWTFTCVTNPATVLFIYPLQCWIGSRLIFNPLTLNSINRDLRQLFRAETWSDVLSVFGNLSWNIIIPFFVGGLFFALVSAIPGYWVSLKLTREYKKRRAERLQRREKNEAGNQ